MHRLNSFLSKDFIFSPRFRVWRHIIYWSFHVIVWSTFWVVMDTPLSFGRLLLNMVMWVPVFILFGYPLVYGAIPHLLLKGKVTLFFLTCLLWGAGGIFLDSGYRSYILIPLQETMGLENIVPRGPLPYCFLCVTTSAASAMIIKFFKLCSIKQRDWLQAQKEKLNAELQLLKAQVHPQFLFNTLNNIHSFSISQCPKTPDLILKLSALLSYMLYDCKAEEVRLEKEIESMKNYIDLEKERYHNKIEISWNVEGKIENKSIAPLLMLPFLENAFKYGISEQIQKPWLSVDIFAKPHILQCRIVNSKNEFIRSSKHGAGIANVKKRLASIYPNMHDLKISEEDDFFVVSLSVKLTCDASAYTKKVEPEFVTEPILQESHMPV